jgi:hypothetical protein
MSGFDNAKVDAEFFPDGQWKSNFLCILGKGRSGQRPVAQPALRLRRGLQDPLNLLQAAIDRNDRAVGHLALRRSGEERDRVSAISPGLSVAWA